MRGRGAATLPGTPVPHNPTWGMRGATSSPHGAAPTPLPTGTGVLRRAQPATSDGASRHDSTSRTTLTILATTPGAVTQGRHPKDPKRATREGARQTDRHEHEHSTTELKQRPGAPMGSTGTHRGGPAGPCHRRQCTYEWHKLNWKYGYGAPRNTGQWIVHATLPGRGREQGTDRGKKSFLQRSNHLSWLFSPAAGGRRTVQAYCAGPTHLAPANIATSGTPAHNKSDCANTRCDDKERTPNKPTKRRLTRPHTARTTTEDAT